MAKSMWTPLLVIKFSFAHMDIGKMIDDFSLIKPSSIYVTLDLKCDIKLERSPLGFILNLNTAYIVLKTYIF